MDLLHIQRIERVISNTFDVGIVFNFLKFTFSIFSIQNMNDWCIFSKVICT